MQTVLKKKSQVRQLKIGTSPRSATKFKSKARLKRTEKKNRSMGQLTRAIKSKSLTKTAESSEEITTQILYLNRTMERSREIKRSQLHKVNSKLFTQRSKKKAKAAFKA